MSITYKKDGFNNLKKIYKTNTILLTTKGVYPYDYVKSLEIFKETNLSPIEAFYSKLNEENISQEDYDHAQTLFKTFNCKTITDYARAACGLQYKMDYTKIKETNITMCNQLYFALKYSALKANLNN